MRGERGIREVSAAVPAVDPADVDAVVEAIGTDGKSLLSILQALQAKYRYLPEAALRRVCAVTEITPSRMEGVIGFYDQFRREPVGLHTIRVCIGTACHVKGAEAVFSGFQRELGLEPGRDTDSKGLFTLEKVACLGCCMLAPAVQIDGTIYGYLSTRRVPVVLEDFLASASMEPQEEAALSGGHRAEVRICLCSSCRAAGSAAVYRAFQEEIAAAGLTVRVKSVGCTGISYEAPLVEVVSRGARFRYGRVRETDVPDILRRHFRPARIAYRTRAALFALMTRLQDAFASVFIGEEAGRETVVRYSEAVRPEVAASAYLERQRPLVTERAGELDPLDIDGYVESGGFEALERCRRELSPEAVIREIAASGLRGRGGAGFPVAAKWESVRRFSVRAAPYAVCNGDEGDPGAFMDRMLLESFPFRVIEGLLIAACAVGAAQGLLYIRGEYPLALERVRTAVEICTARGRLDLGRRAFRLTVVEGAGAFVCGEETALIAALQGERGMPRMRPPYPSERGLDGRPTLVNNVETLAVVPWILRCGAREFRRYGTEKSSGTKIFALAGKVRRGGLVEVPMGTSLREIVEDVGGGLAEGRTLKAIQIGGPSGGCVPASRADTPVDYEALLETGAMMGSGGLIVLDDTDCMVDIARYFLDFTQRESCGKCTFCRIGTKRIVEILELLCSGRARKADLGRLEELALTVQKGSLCGLGRTSVNPVLSTLRHFRGEYEAHVRGECPAGRCRELIRYTVGEECIGCTRCAQSCPVDAIEPRPHQRHEIDTGKCIRCDTCRQVCPVDAVRIETGRAG